MFGRFARHRVSASAAIVAVLGAAVMVAATSAADPDRPGPATAAPDVRAVVGARPLSPPLPDAFVGVSLEFPALLAYTGSNPSAVNPVFEQLLRNLSPGQAPVVRIGGDSGDVTWVRMRGVPRPAGVAYTVSSRWLEATRALARALGARLILGVDLQAGSVALAATEGRAFVRAIGRRYVRALEIGNEPNRYPILPWYRTAPTHLVFARPPGYDFGSFEREFARVRRRLPAIPLAGPTVGGFGWLSHLNGFLAGEPTVGVATVHRYPLNRCFTPVDSPLYPTIPHLLSLSASRGLVAGLGRYVRLARHRGVRFRVDEMNSVACGGKLGVSNTFASALWALDTLFSMARTGVDGVNFHTFPGANYQLFSFRRAGRHWVASVRPEYYGLMMFAQAAPAGSHLVAVQRSGRPDVRAWATSGTAGRVRVLLINADTRSGHTVAVSAPGRSDGLPAALERLNAPGVAATSAITLGGQSFGRFTSSGALAPKATLLRASGGRYVVTLPAASAALVTVPPR